MNSQPVLETIKRILNFPLLPLGGVKITLWTVIYFLVLLLLLFYFTGKIRKLLVERVLVRTKLYAGHTKIWSRR